MLINLTLIHLTYSNFSPSPLISGSISNSIIQNSIFSKSFNHLAYFSKINQIKAYSTRFSFFLKNPFIVSDDSGIVGTAWTCFLFRVMDIERRSLSMILFSLCVFDNTQGFVSSSSINYISISKSIFQNGKNSFAEDGIQIRNCKELYIEKTVFKDCEYKNSLINGLNLQNFTFQNCEVKDCHCIYIFNVNGKASNFQINFNNFINSSIYLFSEVSPLKISYCYFNNVSFIMKCKQTPMGCLSDVNLISCSYEGIKPDGCNGEFNNNNAGTVNIDTFEISDCDFQIFTDYTPIETIAPTPTETPILGPSETPPLSETPLPSETPAETPDPTETAAQSSVPFPSETASESPYPSTLEPTPTCSASPSQTPTPSPSKSTPPPTGSPSQSSTPEATISCSQSPTATPLPEPTKKKFPVIWIILIIVIIIVVIIIIIIIICCIRKCSDMKQENLLDRGLMLKYDSNENSETTSDRSNALNIQRDPIGDDENSDGNDDFFSNRLRNRNTYFKQINEMDENPSSSV